MKISNKKISLRFFIISFIVLLYLLYFNLLYKLLGESGGLIYIGSYSPVIIFLVFFIIGVPHSVSTIISKYDILGYHKTKNRVLKILSGSYMLFSIVLIMLTLLFSDSISNLIIKNNSISSGIKLLSISLFFASVLGIYRGYFEGINHKGYSLISKIIERLIKFISVVIIYIVSLNMKISLSKIITVLFISNILSYILPTIFFILANKKNVKIKLKKEPKISVKSILMSSIKQSFANSVIYIFIVFCFVFDILSLNDVLVDKINYRVSSYQSIISTITIWGIFLIIPFIIFILKLLGNFKTTISKYLVQKDTKKIASYISNIYKKTLFLVIPISVLACFSGASIWKTVYSNSKYGILTYQYLGILILAITIFIIFFQILLSLKEYRMMSIGTIIGVLIKVLFEGSMIYGINKLGLPAFYGAITATFLSLLVPSIIAIGYIGSKYSINIESIVKELFNIITASIIMLIVLIILNHVIVFEDNSNIILILSTLIDFIIGIATYVIVTYRFKTIKNIFN